MAKSVKKLDSKQIAILKKVLRYMKRYWFFLGLSFLLIWAGVGTRNWLLAAVGALFLAGGTGLVLHKLRKRKRK